MSTATIVASTTAGKKYFLSDYPAVKRFTGEVLIEAVDRGHTRLIAVALGHIADAAEDLDGISISTVRNQFSASLRDDVYAGDARLRDGEPAVLEAVTCVVEELSWQTNLDEFITVLARLYEIAVGVDNAVKSF